MKKPKLFGIKDHTGKKTMVEEEEEDGYRHQGGSRLFLPSAWFRG